MRFLHFVTITFLLFIFCYSVSFTQPLWVKTSDLPEDAVGVKIVSNYNDVNIRYCLSAEGEDI